MNESQFSPEGVKESLVKQNVHWGRIVSGVIMLIIFISLGALGGFWYSQQTVGEKAFEMCISFGGFKQKVILQSTPSANPENSATESAH